MQILLRERLESVGISTERVIMKGGVSREMYLDAYKEVDIVLDTFPFSGGTTTCESLWMGVPTVTLIGSTMIARQGASMLMCAGLNEWVANTKEEYVRTAVNHANDIGGLARVRAGLRQKVRSSPLFDAGSFALNLENALHGMWEKRLKQ
jgi:predicted O-linked N-acetylglucosamine transferase (SPINDLY family)